MDDGEYGGGMAALRALELDDRCVNMAVVVSRNWGGIKLGPKRFRHIENAAKSAIVALMK